MKYGMNIEVGNKIELTVNEGTTLEKSVIFTVVDTQGRQTFAVVSDRDKYYEVMKTADSDYFWFDGLKMTTGRIVETSKMETITDMKQIEVGHTANVAIVANLIERFEVTEIDGEYAIIEHQAADHKLKFVRDDETNEIRIELTEPNGTKRKVFGYFTK